MKTKLRQRLLLAALNLAIVGLGVSWHYKPGARAKITSAYKLMAFTTTVPVQLTATGTAPITWSVTGGSLPPGLALASDTGIISGTPTLAGSFTFTATATNAYGSDARTFVIPVNPSGCFITTTSLPGGVTSSVYSQPLNQSGCTGSWSISSFSSGPLPPGLSLNTTTGVISGTPTTPGTYSFMVQIGTDTQTLSIVISGTGACAIPAQSLSGATVGTSYSETPASSNCSGTWAISVGVLPPGLSLNSSTSAITGTPTTAGTYSFTLSNGSVSRPLSILVNASCTITTTAFATGTAGVSYSQSLTDVGCSGSWTATGLPSGFAVSGSSIIGNPSAPSTSSVTILIGTASKTLTLTIGSASGGYDGNIDISQMQTRVLSGGTTGTQFVTNDAATKTIGGVLAWNSNGNAVPIAPGGSGTVLTSNGTSTAPSFQSAGGGGSASLILLESHTASGSSSLNFTSSFSSSYDEYRIEIVGLIPATNGAVPLLRFSTNSGSSYDTSSIYDWGHVNAGLGSAGSGANAGGNVSGITIFADSSGNGLLSTGTPALVASIVVYDPLSASNYKMVTATGIGHYSLNSARIEFNMGGVYKSTTPVNAFQIVMSSGNIASGIVRCYGISH